MTDFDPYFVAVPHAGKTLRENLGLQVPPVAAWRGMHAQSRHGVG